MVVNITSPMHLDEIAQYAGVSGRGLQTALQSFKGMAPITHSEILFQGRIFWRFRLLLYPHTAIHIHYPQNSGVRLL